MIFNSERDPFQFHPRNLGSTFIVGFPYPYQLHGGSSSILDKFTKKQPPLAKVRQNSCVGGSKIGPKGSVYVVTFRQEVADQAPEPSLQISHWDYPSW